MAGERQATRTSGGKSRLGSTVAAQRRRKKDAGLNNSTPDCFSNGNTGIAATRPSKDAAAGKEATQTFPICCLPSAFFCNISAGVENTFPVNGASWKVQKRRCAGCGVAFAFTQPVAWDDILLVAAGKTSVRGVCIRAMGSLVRHSPDLEIRAGGKCRSVVWRAGFGDGHLFGRVSS